MGEKVVSLRDGAAITPPGEPNANVVKLAEDVLERARSGDLMGIAVVMHHSDDTHTYPCAGILDRASIGTIELLKYWLMQND